VDEGISSPLRKQQHGTDRQQSVTFTRKNVIARSSWSGTWAQELTADAESVLQALGLHYRVVSLCTGDLSFAAAKCYDLEVWAPGEKRWLEVSSCSNFVSFQARRAEIRFRDKDGKVRHVHTLNGSGVATPRLMIALLETYQTDEGTVTIPESLQSYFGDSVLK